MADYIKNKTSVFCLQETHKLDTLKIESEGMEKDISYEKLWENGGHSTDIRQNRC